MIKLDYSETEPTPSIEYYTLDEELILSIKMPYYIPCVNDTVIIDDREYYVKKGKYYPVTQKWKILLD